MQCMQCQNTAMELVYNFCVQNTSVCLVTFDPGVTVSEHFQRNALSNFKKQTFSKVISTTDQISGF